MADLASQLYSELCSEAGGVIGVICRTTRGWHRLTTLE